jgi:hypothetical protein
MIYERLDSRLRLTVAELDRMVDVVSGAATGPPAHWCASGVLVDGALHPAVAAMVSVAVRPLRCTLVERFDTERAAPIRIGWQSSGLATVTEVSDDQVTISASNLELLPSFVTGLLRLYPSRGQVDGPPIVTTAGAIDDTIMAVAATDQPVTSSTTPLAEVLTRFVSGWRVTGGWRDTPADTTMTVLDAGTGGLWEVEDTSVDSPARRSIGVVLRPASAAGLLVSVGDVVTGRQPAMASVTADRSGMLC